MPDIQPPKQEFLEYSQDHKRIPVLGRISCPDTSMGALFRQLFANESEAFLFESGNGPQEISRYSMMGMSNGTLFWSDGNKAQLTTNGKTVKVENDPIKFLQDIPVIEKPFYFDYAPPFWGGWVGFVGYEFCHFLESFSRCQKSGGTFPDYFFMQTDNVWVFDHVTDHLDFIVTVIPGTNLEQDYEEAKKLINNAWKELNPAEKKNKFKPEFSMNGNGLPQSNLSEESYAQIVNRVKEYIVDGDIYQANLVQQFTTPFDGCSFELYSRLKTINPAPFSGYFKTSFGTIVSSSPERLIKIDQGCAETRPIAGTRPRGQNLAEDDRLSAELLLNEKEKAEHLMLVDLERNDLGRICKNGSVKVDSLMFLEKYSHVIHIVSNIQGQLKSDLNLADILKAVFPGGTITGCPKIRCMEIIDELEPDTRGPYSGSMGYIGYGSNLDLNILIRSIMIKDGKASFHVGAGIVADSDPSKEYQETLDKAAAMIEALSGEQS